MRLVGSILSLLVAAFFGLASAANFAPDCGTLPGLPGVLQPERICVNDPGRGLIFAGLAVVFLVFAALAFSSHRTRKSNKREALSPAPAPPRPD